MTGNLNMVHHTVIGIRSHSAENAALTVGGAKATYLPISFIRGMQGDLNLDGFTVTNLKPFVEINSAKPSQDNKVINFGYFHTQRGLLKRLIGEVGSDALNRKNPDPRKILSIWVTILLQTLKILEQQIHNIQPLLISSIRQSQIIIPPSVN